MTIYKNRYYVFVVHSGPRLDVEKWVGCRSLWLDVAFVAALIPGTTSSRRSVCLQHETISTKRQTRRHTDRFVHQRFVIGSACKGSMFVTIQFFTQLSDKARSLWKFSASHLTSFWWNRQGLFVFTLFVQLQIAIVHAEIKSGDALGWWWDWATVSFDQERWK